MSYSPLSDYDRCPQGISIAEIRDELWDPVDGEVPLDPYGDYSLILEYHLTVFKTSCCNVVTYKAADYNDEIPWWDDEIENPYYGSHCHRQTEPQHAKRYIFRKCNRRVHLPAVYSLNYTEGMLVTLMLIAETRVDLTDGYLKWRRDP